jgi:aspartyl-tRNA synthetase
MHAYRTHTCGELTQATIGQTVKLSGWVHRKRDHGQLLFIDVRDHYGITQLVLENDQPFFEMLNRVRLESVITVEGKVIGRTAETVNPELSTGEIEVRLTAAQVESEADPLPLQVNAERDLNENIRLRYRFLDLRRESLHKNIILRSQIITALRRKMTERGFNEFQTPILTASSPEGARDYLVPSRVHPGKFYALPQAPQQFKQLLMVAGFDRYFQIAPCFRDEDARADRSPGEFYQLDMEMSFVTQDDVFAAIEPVLYEVFSEFSTKEATKPPFVRIPYDEAMEKYGSDKPDLRNPLIISDLTEEYKENPRVFKVFNQIIDSGGVLKAIKAENIAQNPRSFFDKLEEWAISEGAKGLAYIKFELGIDELKEDIRKAFASLNSNDSVESRIELIATGKVAKLFSEEFIQAAVNKLGVKANDVIFFVCDQKEDAQSFAGKVRNKLGDQLNLIDPNVFKFCWIVDFPYFEWNKDERKIEFSHNPFSMPQGGLEALQAAKGNTEKLLAMRAYQYDIVCNGVELSSGAIRNHRPEIMYEAFGICGYPPSEVDERFGGMIRAFKLGAPPHGGLAPGVDRMVMLIADEPNIREVIAFPMNQQAQDLLMGAPATVTEKQLRELNIQLSPKALKMLEEERQKQDGQADEAA